jgi:hypothetical protein
MSELYSESLFENFKVSSNDRCNNKDPDTMWTLHPFFFDSNSHKRCCLSLACPFFFSLVTSFSLFLFFLSYLSLLFTSHLSSTCINIIYEYSFIQLKCFAVIYFEGTICFPCLDQLRFLFSFFLI